MRPETQEKQTKVKFESDVASAADSAQNDPGQASHHALNKKQFKRGRQIMQGPSAIGPATQNTSGIFSSDSGNSFSS